MSLKKQIRGSPIVESIATLRIYKDEYIIWTLHSCGEHSTDTEGLAVAEVPCAVKMQKEGLKVLGNRLLMLVKIKEREES